MNKMCKLSRQAEQGILNPVSLVKRTSVRPVPSAHSLYHVFQGRYSTHRRKLSAKSNILPAPVLMPVLMPGAGALVGEGQWGFNDEEKERRKFNHPGNQSRRRHAATMVSEAAGHVAASSPRLTEQESHATSSLFSFGSD